MVSASAAHVPKKKSPQALLRLRDAARQIGKALEVNARIAVKRTGRATSIEQSLRLPGTAKGRAYLERAFKSAPFPRYETVAQRPGLFVRTNADGRQEFGRFMGRKFVVAAKK
jgi:hypothetical protein